MTGISEVDVSGRSWWRRRWVLAVTVVAVLCVGAPLTAVAVFFGAATLDAGRGEESPVLAVSKVMGAFERFTYGNDLTELLPTLCDEGQAVLVERLRELRGQLFGDEGVQLKTRGFSPVVRDGGVDVEAGVYAVAPGAGATAFHGAVHTWRFATVERNGWVVCGFEAPDFCDVYVNC